MTKKYKLLKDLPDAKAGAIFVHNYSYNRYYLDGNILGSYWDKEFVEDNPTWFQEVLPVSEPVKERIKVGIRYHCYGGELVIDANKIISEEYFPAIKKSIESALNDTVVEDKKATVTLFKQIYENYKVKSDNGYIYNYGFYSDVEIGEEQFPIIEKSVEDILNDTIVEDKIYNQEQMDKAIVDAFYAARQTKNGTGGDFYIPFSPLRYSYHQDYLNHLKQNK